MEFTVKTYGELTKDELYAIIKARIDVFVVEQNCPYRELDGLDKHALHIFSMDEDGSCTSYLRAFMLDADVAQIGRVLTVRRGEGLGGELLSFAIEAVTRRFAPEKLYVEAQTQAVGFYMREGFKIVSDEFDEDGIPHVQMELNVSGNEHKMVHIEGDVEIPMELNGADFERQFGGFIHANGWTFSGNSDEKVEVKYVGETRTVTREQVREELRAHGIQDKGREAAVNYDPVELPPDGEPVYRSRIMRTYRRGKKGTAHQRRSTFRNRR